MPTPSMEHVIFAALPGTIPEIMKRTGVGRACAYNWLKAFRAESKAHIKGWRRTTGQSSPYFVAGPGEDAPRPKRQTGAAYNKRHYRKHRRDLDKELRASANAARANAASTRTKPQTWLSALGVVA